MKRFYLTMIVMFICVGILSLFTGHAGAQAKIPEVKKDPAIVFTPDGYVVMTKESFETFLRKRQKDQRERNEMLDYIEALLNGKCS